jgi:hypothetical protein
VSQASGSSRQGTSLRCSSCSAGVSSMPSQAAAGTRCGLTLHTDCHALRPSSKCIRAGHPTLLQLPLPTLVSPHKVHPSIDVGLPVGVHLHAVISLAIAAGHQVCGYHHVGGQGLQGACEVAGVSKQ